MAFYKDVPDSNKKKRNYANEGAWEEEGSRYRNNNNAANRRFGPGGDRSSSSRGDRPGFRNDFSSKRSFGEKREFAGRGAGRNGMRSEDRRDFNRNDRPERSDRPNRHSSPRNYASFSEAPKRSYLDFEQKKVTPAVQNVSPKPAFVTAEPVEVPENLLAGRNPIREAIRSGRDIEKLLVQRGELSGSAREIVQMARENHVVVQEVDKQRLDEIAPHHQGMVAYASAYKYSTVEAMLQDAKDKNEDPFLILLDGVTDPHNLGAVIRTAECVGAHGVIVPERRSAGLTPSAVKASAGAVEHMKVARVTNLNRTIEQLKEHGVWLYAVTMDGEDYEHVNFKGGVALVIGAEGEGISRLTLENCDCKVSLPMAGHIDSLNASVAAGVVMYRVLSSRKA